MENECDRRLAEIDDALAAGVMTEQEWYARNSAALEAAYLAGDTPRRQSGLNGDAARWARRRRVIAEAIDRDGTFLDVGCANGLLMETLVGWAAQRGYQIEPFGLDISPRLAALARQRLPAWADRIFTGNVMSWAPVRRFDYARTELVYVPSARQADLVGRLLEQVIAPGGRLVACAYRSRGAKHADPVDGGIATRVAWVDVAG